MTEEELAAIFLKETTRYATPEEVLQAFPMDVSVAALKVAQNFGWKSSINGGLEFEGWYKDQHVTIEICGNGKLIAVLWSIDNP